MGDAGTARLMGLVGGAGAARVLGQQALDAFQSKVERSKACDHQDYEFGMGEIEPGTSRRGWLFNMQTVRCCLSVHVVTFRQPHLPGTIDFCV